MRGFCLTVLAGGVALVVACSGDDDHVTPGASTSASSSSGTTGATATSSGTPQTSTTSSASSSTSGETSTTSSSSGSSGFPRAALSITTNPAPGPDGKYRTSPVEVTIAATTPDAVVYYTTDGTQPTSASKRYEGPFSVSIDTTVLAVRAGESYADTAVCLIDIDLDLCGCTLTPPSFAPTGGEQTNTFTVAISLPPSEGWTPCYTTDGTTDPSCTNGVCNPGSTKFEAAAPVPVNVTNTTIRAIGCKAGAANTAVVAQTYSLRVAPVTATPAPPSNDAGPTDVTLSTATQNAMIHYTTDGTPVSCSNGTAAPSPASVTVAAGTTINAIGCRSAFLDSPMQTFTYGQ